MNKKYKDDFIRAGQLAKEVRQYGKGLIVPGASYMQVIQAIQKKIFDLGAIPAFPPQMALDHVAAHFLPQPEEDIIFQTQVVKLDIGVCYNGAIGDCAVTIDLSGANQKLVDAAEAALLAAEQLVCVGRPLRELGQAIEAAAKSFGFNPVKDLSGHGLGYYKVHVPPTVPNFDNHSTAVIRPGMTFAIEPFVTKGTGRIFDAGNPAIFSYVTSGPTRSAAARTLLKKIKTFNGLPFATHDLLSEELPLAEIHVGLQELLKTGILYGHAPLIEQTHQLVAQAENSVLVDDQGQVTITTR
jgi:methionyl aminopeptidase